MNHAENRAQFKHNGWQSEIDKCKMERKGRKREEKARKKAEKAQQDEEAETVRATQKLREAEATNAELIKTATTKKSDMQEKWRKKASRSMTW